MTNLCKVCKQPLDAHALIMYDGVAHTIVYLGNEKRLCSVADADRRYLTGEIMRLKSIIRSLRNRAGRLRRREAYDTADAFDLYSDKVVADCNRLINGLRQYYPWY